MLDIRELDNSVNLKDPELVTKLDWDVVSFANQYVEFNVTDSEVPGFNTGDEKMVFFDYQIPLQIYRIKGYYHCIYGTGEGVDLYACPRGEEPTLENLQAFDDRHWSVWGITTRPNVYNRKGDLNTSYKTIITRNGVEFDTVGGRDMSYALIEAQAMIHKLEEPNLPFSFATIDFDKKIVGYKCEWRGRPCTIKSYIMGQNCVILDILGLEGDYDEGEEIKDHIMSSSFDWFAEERKRSREFSKGN